MIVTICETITENKKQDWLKTGQNELNDKMRGDQDETTLARNIITYLAKYLGAQIGALYVTQEEDGDLKLVGSYAFSKRKNLNERIKIGENLVGQAAYEKELISVTNIPKDYTRIGSAIGNAIPRNVVVSPFMMDGQLSGVIEFGAFKEFSDAELELLNATMENIAVNFNSTQANARMKFLLEETQRQAEELESQQEELRQSNENLETQSEELRRANEDLVAQKTEIERKNMEVEQKAEELAISSKYKSEFLANMSHELRTPLNSLLLLSSSLAKNKEGNLTKEQVRSAAVIHSGGNDLLILINEILDLSKIEAGMMDVEFKAIRIQEAASKYQKAGGTGSLSEVLHAQDDSAIVAQALKENITFANYNLATDSVFGEMHLILCRNVLIYFDRTLQNQTHHLFNDSQIYKGFLCLGSKESLDFSDVRSYYKTVDKKQKIYQKIVR